MPTFPPSVPALTNLANRPLWSVMIPVYNCLHFLPQTLESVLQHNISPDKMQIEVVDDGSSDGDVEGLVNTIGQGRVKYFRQPANVGSLRNFHTCLLRSRGYYVHLLHGDDLVRKGYYYEIEQLFSQYNDAGAAFCRFINIDEKGKKIDGQPEEMPEVGVLNDWLFKIAVRQRIQYAAITVKREVYEQLGSFYGLDYGEDWLMWVRIAKQYKFAYTPMILAEYRKHPQSISGKKYSQALYINDLEKTIGMIRSELPENLKAEVFKTSRVFYSHYALNIAYFQWKNLKNKKGAYNNIKRGEKLQPDIFFWLRDLNLRCKIFFGIR